LFFYKRKYSERAIQGKEKGLPPEVEPPGENEKIAFSSNRVGGNWDIYVMNADDGGEVTRLTNNPDYDVVPYWSPVAITD
jgi:hypothetical protein